MRDFFFSLMCISALVGMDLHAEEYKDEVIDVEEEDVKVIPFKISQIGEIAELAITESSTAFLVTPPTNTFILRNSLQVSDSNSKELPLKVIGQLSVGVVGNSKNLVLNDSFRVMVDQKHGAKKNAFIRVKFTACVSNNVCYYPMTHKVLLND